MENNNVQVGFFNLKKGGDSATVRLLYTSCSKLTILKTHNIPNGINPNTGNPANKRVKCLGDSCPICKSQRYPVEDRLYLHLFDYSDNTEKVWDRTANPKFIQSLIDLENNWGDIKTPAMTIKRDSDDFPTYTVSAFPGNTLAPIADDRYDIDVSYRCGIYRSEEELEQALNTGVVPPHTKKPSTNNNNAQYGNPPRNTVMPPVVQQTAPAFVQNQTVASANNATIPLNSTVYQTVNTAPYTAPNANNVAYNASKQAQYETIPVDDDLPF